VNFAQIFQIVGPILYIGLLILALLAPVVLLAVVFLDLFLIARGKKRSVGDDLSWWSTHYIYLAWPVTFFWGFLLAHLFTQR